MTPEIYIANGNEPLDNLSFEECVLDSERLQLPVLVLYENRDAVVIGKNQNPWLECDPEALEDCGIPLFRRISGGGTVFHCLGNLNIGFVVPRKNFDRRYQLQIVASALSVFGLVATISERGDILYEGWKISGNAMCFRRDRVLHHVTLLCDADLGRLHFALRPADSTIETRAIASYRMPVANIRDFAAEATVSRIRDSIVHSFNNVYSMATVRTADDIDSACLTERRKRHVSWAWRFGRTPRFTARTAGGVRVFVRDGMVRSVITGAGEERRLDTAIPFSANMTLPDQVPGG